MSILGKMKGIESPLFWDMLHVTAGIISALAKSVLKSGGMGKKTMGRAPNSLSEETGVHRPSIKNGKTQLTSVEKLFSPLTLDSHQRIHAKIIAEQRAEARREPKSSTTTSDPFRDIDLNIPPVTHASAIPPNESAERKDDAKDWQEEDEKLFHTFAKIFDAVFRVEFKGFG